MRRYYLYRLLAVSSSKLLHQIHELDQILVAEETSTSGDRNKRIRCGCRSPTRWNRTQMPLGIVKVDPILSPVMPIGHQLELLASQRMVRVGYLEVGIDKVPMPCS